MRRLVPALLLTSALILSASPAHAAVPKGLATIVVWCDAKTNDKAKVWTYDANTNTSGVRNRCDRKWLVITFFHAEGHSTVSVAPHTEALWTGGPPMHSPGPDVSVQRKPETCAPLGSWLQLQGSHGDPQRVQCGERIRGTHVKHWR